MTATPALTSPGAVRQVGRTSSGRPIYSRLCPACGDPIGTCSWVRHAGEPMHAGCWRELGEPPPSTRSCSECPECGQAGEYRENLMDLPNPHWTCWDCMRAWTAEEATS